MSVPETAGYLRLTEHTDRTWTRVHASPALNKVMGTVGFAEWRTELRCYLIPSKLLSQLERFANHNDLDLYDDRPAEAVQFTRLCDICGKPENVCEASAANTGPLRDHDFTSRNQGKLRRHPRRNA